MLPKLWTYSTSNRISPCRINTNLLCRNFTAPVAAVCARSVLLGLRSDLMTKLLRSILFHMTKQCWTLCTQRPQWKN